MVYDKRLLNELRLAAYKKGDRVLTEENLVKAITLNEKLQGIGYTMRATDIVGMASSSSIDTFYDKIASMLDTVDADPMYPGFPEEVMEMDEAVFRFHQMVHYFSTYGMTLLFGVEVKRGWLPHENDKKLDLAPQDRVLKAKVIELVPEEDWYIVPLRRILSKRERMTIPEKEIVSEAIRHVSEEQIKSINVAFKENMNAMYEIIFKMEDKKCAMRVLRALCQHTGDVMRCIKVILQKNKFHLRTSQKKFFVKLLEMYPVGDFRSNLVLSSTKAEESIMLLDRLDYGVYSRSADHMQAVNDLKDGNLRSWNSSAIKLLHKKSDKALEFVARRPGIMLRWLANILRLGYSREDVVRELSKHAGELSVQTLVGNMNYFGKLTNNDRADADDLYISFEELLRERMKYCETILRGKKVFVSMPGFDLEHSNISANSKSAEGGYVQSGLAYKIPESINRLRFFVYWNDEHRVDVDLHSWFDDLDGETHHIGWNGDFNDGGVVFSGDITHSDAAEYVDIDMNAPIAYVYADIDLFSGKPTFKQVDTCFAGMMAVPKKSAEDEPSALYSDANCFFKHHLKQECEFIHYGFIDVQNRCLVFTGEPGTHRGRLMNKREQYKYGRLTLDKYLKMLFAAQNAVLCDNPDEADIVLVMEKAETEKEVSLIDENFFMD